MDNTAQNQDHPKQKKLPRLEREADRIIHSVQHYPVLRSPVVRQHYTQVASSLHITAEILTILSGNKFKMPARTIASAIGIIGNLLGVVFKQQPQLKEELDKLSRMSTGEYIFTRLKQSLEPQKHIRQTIAASMMAACVAGMIAAIKSEPKRYGEGIGSAIGFISACVLSFTKDDRKAWERQSVIVSALATPNNIFYGGEAAIIHHDMYIPSAMALHTVANGLTFVETYGRQKDGAQSEENKNR